MLKIGDLVQVKEEDSCPSYIKIHRCGDVGIVINICRPNTDPNQYVICALFGDCEISVYTHKEILPIELYDRS